MTTEGHRRAKKIFSLAKGLKTEEREEVLDQSCEGDEGLRAEVETLLALDEELERAERSATNPTVIGPFRVIRRLGEGGMGEVWEAEQQEPVRRRVALKLVKWGMDTEQVLARFEVERQALAMMNHENIAKVYEAGATDDGRPYFAMECVDGPDIVEFCDLNCLSVEERIELFSQICSGVQHAHQKGVIHRDLKPSNVLVSSEDGRPVPKIIDFGVAKAISQRLTEHTLFTELGHWIGTPEYMSPEQAEVSSSDIDTRTDVYSLGVLLYELIAGAPPVDSSELREAGFDEMRRRIREENPVRPSTRVSRMGPASSVAAANRRTDAPGLMKELRGDLDWIVLKALEKDRERRYGSAAAFAEDIERHLRHEPVAASPPSAMYRIGKYIRRNRLVVVSVVLIVAAMLTAIVGTTLGLHRARQEAETARMVSHFLESMVLDLDPFSTRGQTADPRQILDRSRVRIETEFEDRPLERARLLTAMGVAYDGLGEYGLARPLLEESAVIRLEHLGPNHPDYATSLSYLGDLLFDFQDDEAALRKHETAFDIRIAALSPGHPQIFESLERLAIAQYMTRDCQGALKLSHRALAMVKRLDIDGGSEIEGAIAACGAIAASCGNHELARALLEDTGLIDGVLSGPDSLGSARTLFNYAATLDWLGRSGEALQYVERALTIWETLDGPEDRAFFKALDIAGGVSLNTGNIEQARRQLERVVAAEKAYFDTRLDLEFTFYNLAAVYALRGDSETALNRLQDALDRGFAHAVIFDDEKLDSLRGMPEFEAIVAEVERRIVTAEEIERKVAAPSPSS